jgi:nucleotide-binding universal stress UspA family protein
MAFTKILVPVDFSPDSAKALEMAIELAKSFGARIHLIHCYPINVGGISPYGMTLPVTFDLEIRDAAQQKLAEWSEKATAEGIQTDETVMSMFPSEAIATLAREKGADLIVMGTRGLTGLKHIVLGSVAERALRIAPCPVLIVKADEA